MLTHGTSRMAAPILVALGLSVCAAAPALAQDPVDSQGHAVGINASFDVLNEYVFRGVRQNSTGVVMWPSVDLAVTPHLGDGAFKKVRVGVGFWNSLHTGDTGSDGPSGDAWYESRFNATVGFGFGRGVSVGTTYSAYTSPNDMFTTVKELGVRVDIDDRKALGRGALRPYALVAFELDTQPGIGQLDGGMHAGRYLEVGISPAYTAKSIKVAMPLKVGLSLSNYYELADKDNAFGFFSAGAIATVPIRRSDRFGTLSVHGGLDVPVFGETTKVFNGGDRSTVVGLIGLGLSY